MKHFLLVLLIVCSLSAFSSITISLTMNFENTSRSFLVHLPNGFSNSEHLPLVINMHGSGSNGPQEEFYSRMSETADSNHFIVCYPNGINNVWNSGDTAPYNKYPDDVGFVSKIIDTLYGLYNIDPARVYACGMSNGGFQSYRLACDLENRIAAIASVAGCITDLTALNCVLSRHIPVLHIHGTNDPLVIYSGEPGYKSVEETINFFLMKNQCSGTNDTIHYPDIDVTDSSTVERIHYPNCADGTEVMFYKITGGGHTWPNAYLDWIYGPTNRDLDASQEIWNFFSRFSLNGPLGTDNSVPEAVAEFFPNPVSNDLQVKFDERTSTLPKLSLYDLMGKKLLEQPLLTNTQTIHLSNYLSGVYIVRFDAGDYTVVKRIVKE